MKKRQVLSIVFLLLVVLAFQGCTGCGEKALDFASNASSGEVAGGGDGAPLEGKPQPGTYYRIIPGFACANGEVQNQGSIEVTATSAKLRAIDPVSCTESVQVIALPTLRWSLLTPQVLGMGEGIYEKLERVPEPRTLAKPYVETWCQSPAAANFPLSITISEDLATHELRASLAGAAPKGATWEFLPIENRTVTRASLGSSLSYQSAEGASPMKISINRQTALASGEFTGHLTAVYSGRSYESAVNCRVGGIFDAKVTAKPYLTFDFSQAPLASAVTYLRAGQGSAFDVNGNVVVLAANQPRYDHDRVTGRPLGLLLERGNTNVLLHSEDLTAAAWTPVNVSVAEEGTLVGLRRYRIQKNNPAQLAPSARILQDVVTTPGPAQAVSFFVQAGNTSLVRLTISQSATEERIIDFDLSNESIVTDTGSVPALNRGFEKLRNGYRVFITLKPTAASFSVGIGPASGSFGDYIYATGAQFTPASEAPTSYIPTSSQQATRGHDILRMTDVSWFAPAAGTLLFNASRNGIEQGGPGGNPHLFVLKDAGLDEYRTYYSEGTLKSVMKVGAGQTIDIVAPQIAYDERPNAPQLFSMAYSENNSSVGLNGQLMRDSGVSPVGLVPTVLELGSQGDWAGHLRSFSYWPQRLSDDALRVLGQ